MSKKSIQFEDSADDEGAWIFSYADMMSLLCCFFILLYKVTADEDKMKNISERIAETLKGAADITSEEVIDPSEEERKVRAFEMLTAMLDLGDSVEDAVGNIERKFSDEKNSESYKKIFEEDLDESSRKSLEVLKKRNIDEDVLLTIVLPGDSTFKSGSATLQRDATEKLTALAKKMQLIKGSLQVEVTGHTDSVPVGSSSRWQSNWDLSAARASSVAKYLTLKGIEGKKIKVRGASSFEPIFSEKVKDRRELRENRRKNRRVEIRIKRQRYKKG